MYDRYDCSHLFIIYFFFFPFPLFLSNHTSINPSSLSLSLPPSTPLIRPATPEDREGGSSLLLERAELDRLFLPPFPRDTLPRLLLRSLEEPPTSNPKTFTATNAPKMMVPIVIKNCGKLKSRRRGVHPLISKDS